jgi:hypothetical protein
VALTWAISSYFGGGCQYTRTLSGEIAGRGEPMSTWDEVEQAAAAQTRMAAGSKAVTRAMMKLPLRQVLRRLI